VNWPRADDQVTHRAMMAGASMRVYKAAAGVWRIKWRESVIGKDRPLGPWKSPSDAARKMLWASAAGFPVADRREVETSKLESVERATIVRA